MARYAVFSEKQKEMAGSSFYSDLKGGTVEVTCVEDIPGCPTCLWDDKQDRGEVGEWVRRGHVSDRVRDRELEESRRLTRRRR